MKVAYEAGPFGFWLPDKLVEDGRETLVVPPEGRKEGHHRDSEKILIRIRRMLLDNVPYRMTAVAA